MGKISYFIIYSSRDRKFAQRLVNRIGKNIQEVDEINIQIDSKHDVTITDLVTKLSDKDIFLILLSTEPHPQELMRLIGSSLEVHLRRIATKHSIDLKHTTNKGILVDKKANTINFDIKKERVYNEQRRSQIETWFKLRNQAAHGEYDEYELEEVKLFLAGIRDFMIKFPA